ncbi:MAG: DNA-binding protein [Candidatus Thiodiazotropha taylori]|nr:DNA-binding protein [Candidatus Thiodiazotropha taylori]MCW4306797.1 DNA-binding protein [Candidatus Thiodiazotropha endolucinida]
MARPGIPESAYREAFDRLVAEGRRVEDINANMLQQAVGGGRYGRAADFLEQFRDEYRQQQAQAERLPDKPQWFRDFVASVTAQVEAATDGQWAALFQDTQVQVQAVTKDFEQKREALELKRKDDRAQIEQLEDEKEALQNKQTGLMDELKAQQEKHEQQRSQYEHEQHEEQLALKTTIAALEARVETERESFQKRINELEAGMEKL